MIPQNEALGINFSKNLVSRSFEFIRGQKSVKKGQISIFFEMRHIKPRTLYQPFSLIFEAPVAGNF